MAPTDVNRGSNGGRVSFDFDGTGIAAGALSSIFFVETNAPSFDGVGSLTANGTFSNVGSSFEPAGIPAAVPEPSSIVLCGLAGLMGLGYTAKRRRAIA